MSFTGSTFDEQLAAALAESLLAEGTRARRVRWDAGPAHQIQRAAVAPRAPHAALQNFGDPQSVLEQRNTVNQFHSAFIGAADQFDSPRSVCGFLAVASALLCNQELGQQSSRHHRRVVSSEQLDALENALRLPSALLPGVRHAMRFVQQARSRYMRSHPEAFATEGERREYLRAWVANYEVSDYLRHMSQSVTTVDERVLQESVTENPAVAVTRSQAGQSEFDAGGGGGAGGGGAGSLVGSAGGTNVAERLNNDVVSSCCYLCGTTPIGGRRFRKRDRNAGDAAPEIEICARDFAQLSYPEKSLFVEVFTDEALLQLNNTIDLNNRDANEVAPCARGLDAVEGIVFLRFNQSSEIPTASHEELERLLHEEAQFMFTASQRASGRSSAGSDVSADDVLFLVESFCPERMLLTPEEFVQLQLAGAIAPPRIFVLDLNGHFCIGVPANGRDGCRKLVLFNTTDTNYLAGVSLLTAAMAFDLSFPRGHFSANPSTSHHRVQAGSTQVKPPASVDDETAMALALSASMQSNVSVPEGYTDVGTVGSSFAGSDLQLALALSASLDAAVDDAASCTKDVASRPETKTNAKQQPPLILLVASKDEPNGIADDFFLLHALRQYSDRDSQRQSVASMRTGAKDRVHFKWILWDAPPLEWPALANLNVLPIVRSLWEGRDRRGATPELRGFLQKCGAVFPPLALDYELLVTISHKQYLIELQSRGVPTIPSELVKQHASDYTDADVAEPGADGHGRVAATPGGVKHGMVQRQWLSAVLKPTVGTRCEGVLRLDAHHWTLKTAVGVAALLESGDCLLQPFMPPVQDSNSLWGEVCILFLDGEVIHAIHKHPQQWGWHRSSCPCASTQQEDLAQAICSCSALGGSAAFGDSKCAGSGVLHKSGTTPLLASAECRPQLQQLPIEAAKSFEIAPVQALQMPLPAALLDPALTALRTLALYTQEKSGFAGPEDYVPFLCRIDMLPWRNPSTGQVEWLFSEAEGQWCECFLRAAPQGVAEKIVAALINVAIKGRVSKQAR